MNEYLPKITKILKIKEKDFNLISLFEGTIGIRGLVNDINESNIDNLREEIPEITEVNFSSLIQGIIISPEMFDPYWNNYNDGWAQKGELRGGREYDPPSEYYGYGIKVSGKYDNDTWIGMKNRKGEWWVAYHGIGRGRSNDNVKQIIGKIMNEGLKPGDNQAYEYDDNCNELSNAEYSKVGIGVYLSDKIETAQIYAGTIKIEYDNDIKEYYTVLMCRVNPEKTRFSDEKKEYFVLDPNEQCIRPYRILIKPVNN